MVSGNTELLNSVCHDGNCDQSWLTMLLGKVPQTTTRILEILGCFLNFNKMKTKIISNHMSQYFIHNKTQIT